MKKLFFALASLAVLALGFGLVLVVLSPSKEPASSELKNARPAPAPAAQASAPAAEIAAAQTLDAEVEAKAPEVAPASARAAVRVVDARTFGEWANRERRVLKGRVVLPAGAPADPTLAVVSLAEEMTPRRVYGSMGAIDSLRFLERERAAADDAHAHAPGLNTPATGQVLAVAPVAADGAFEIPFPADREHGWLAVDGRFLYSKPAARVTLADAEIAPLVVLQGAWLTGEVRLPAGVEDPAAALAGLRVELEPDPERFGALDVGRREAFERKAAVDAEGRFEFRGVSPDVWYVARVESDALADATVPDLELKAGKGRHVVVELVHGGSVSGRVLDHTGAPVADALVEAATGSLFGFAPYDAGQTTTGVDGWFEIPHVPPGRVQIVAKKEGHLDSTPKRVEVRDRESTEGVLMELSRGARVAGVVRRADGSPAAGVEVEVDFDPEALAGMGAFNAARGADGEAETGPDGRFEITGLGRGPFLVTVEHEEGDVELGDRKSGVKPDTLDLDLVLRPAPVLAGLVQNARGEPLLRFHVRAEGESMAFWLPSQAIEKDFESADGSFQLTGFSPGEWRVQASADGWAASPWTSLELPAPDGAAPVVLVLEAEAIVAGVVLDPDGKPIEGAVVRRERTMLEAIADIGKTDGIGEARSDETGAFTLGGLGTGAVSLVAAHERFVESEAIALDVVSGTRTEDVVLRLRRGGTLTGVVFDDQGEPVAGANIVMQDTVTFVPTMLKSGPDGTFRREDLKPGRWQVTAMSSEFDAASMFEGEEPDLSAFMTGMKTATATVIEGEVVHVQLGAPPSDPVRVVGSVTHAGEPVGKTLITFLGEGTGMGGMRFVPTDADGRFEVVLDKPGRYMMQIQALGATAMTQNSTEHVEEVPEVEEHRVDVELPVGRISGRILGHDGKPLANARVTLTCEDGQRIGSMLGGHYAEQLTDAEGRYDIKFLAPGTYQIAAGGALAGGVFGTSADAGREVRSGVRLEEGEWIEDLEFRLAEPGELTGRVVDGTGAPVASAAIFVRNEDGVLLERFSMIESDSSGRFRYSGVAPGRYTVSARTRDLASPESQPVNVPKGGTADATITLAVGTMLKVSVVDDADAAVDASIRVIDEEGRQVSGMLAYQDFNDPEAQLFISEEERIGPLPPGRYTVLAEKDGSVVTKPVTLTGQSERKLKLRFR